MWKIISIKYFSVGQFFGNLPVNGILDRDFENIRFEWCSLRTIYAITYLLVGAFEVSLCVLKDLQKVSTSLLQVKYEIFLLYFESIWNSINSPCRGYNVLLRRCGAICYIFALGNKMEKDR